MKIKFVLGSEDNEMNLIEKILLENNLDYTYASINGIRCNQENAYHSDIYISNEYEQIIFIECDSINK